MTFTVEDGSIVDGANSFVSVADADSYHSTRGNASWTGTDAVKEAALVRATDYIQQKYNGAWKGCLVSYSQPLDWPRSGITGVDEDAIPQRLKSAVCELALEALSATLNPSLERGGAIKREKIDVIEVEYMDSAIGSTKRPAVDGFLSPYLSGSGINVPVVRV